MQIPPTIGCRFLGWLWRAAALLLVVLAPARALAQPAPAAEPKEDAAEAPLSTPATLPSLPATDADKARGATIVRIDVVGNQRVTKSDILTYLRERVGTAFAPETLSQDVRELWNSGYFDDIVVELDRGDDGVGLRFVVRERPSIGQVVFTGNDEIDSDDLLEAIEVKDGTILSYPAVQRSVQKIRDMYAEKGFFLAEVKSEVIPQKNNEVVIRFNIKEEAQVSVRRITFIGNHSISDDELREVMFTGNAGFFAFGSGGPFRQDAFERDIAVISALYYDRGFLSVQISTPRVMLTPDKSGIEVSLTIDEGPRYRIRQLRVYERGVEGTEVEPINGRRNLRNMVRAKPGDYFNRAELLEDLQAVRTLYRDHGYANVEANPQTRLDPERAEVDIVVPVIRGPLVYFERIEVRGNSKTRDKVIRREMEVTEGELFNETRLEKSRQRITALGFFERVDVSTEEGSAPDKMQVNVEVTERPTGTFQVGAGFSSIENFIATAQVQQANLFGHGQSLSLQAQVSGLRQLVNLRFYEPYFLDSPFSASVDLYDQLRIFNDFSQSSRGGSLTFGYPLVEPELTASVTYTAELDRVSTQTQSTFLGTSSAVSVFTRLPLANLFNDGLTSSIRPALTYDTRDNRLFPTAGIYLRGSTELATPILASDNEFIRHRFQGRFYYPIGAGFVLKLNTEAGHVTSPSSEGVPIFARFFLGGILDVRGFRFRTIGPRIRLTRSTDPNSAPILNGANIGGNLMYFQNLELEFPIIDKVGIRGVLFTDAGNAWNLEDNYCQATGSQADYAVTSPCFDGLSSLAALRTSYGFGIRWFSPLGPLRFEWGFPFKPLPYEESSVFEFTIGNFF
ncbi:MAG: outer membrane protein assembly factor BamA [Myxococcales bacterium]|nr:outer membrane protein assembly factor BamA [Myxococcales bacterium]MCB9576423.1 outer membrane protein assembly factor BamA [Polyangiaceae bacterium]